jgi:hypothetical protein
MGGGRSGIFFFHNDEDVLRQRWVTAAQFPRRAPLNQGKSLCNIVHLARSIAMRRGLQSHDKIIKSLRLCFVAKDALRSIKP